MNQLYLSTTISEKAALRMDQEQTSQVGPQKKKAAMNGKG